MKPLKKMKSLFDSMKPEIRDKSMIDLFDRRSIVVPVHAKNGYMPSAACSSSLPTRAGSGWPPFPCRSHSINIAFVVRLIQTASGMDKEKLAITAVVALCLTAIAIAYFML